jgi:peroxiredoxin
MVPEAGSVAPDFELSDSSGTPLRLGALVDAGRRVLIFYRGHW